MNDPVADVVASCRQGDRDAQRELFEKFQTYVYRLTVRMVGLADAADVTQQVFLQLFRVIDQFRGKSRFSTWPRGKRFLTIVGVRDIAELTLLMKHLDP